jgi:hypothetical protein
MEVDLDDGDLLRAFCAGDSQAFAMLYERYDRASFLFVRRMLTSREMGAAEDVHQDAWIAIAQNARSFDATRGSFRTWLFTIARRKVWDHLRRQKVAVLAAPLYDAAAVPDPDVTPEDHALSRDGRAIGGGAGVLAAGSTGDLRPVHSGRSLPRGHFNRHGGGIGDREEPASLRPCHHAIGARGRKAESCLITTRHPIQSTSFTGRPRRSSQMSRRGRRGAIGSSI